MRAKRAARGVAGRQVWTDRREKTAHPSIAIIKLVPLNFLCARFLLPKCHFRPDLPVFLGLGGVNGIYLTRVIGATFGQKVGGHGLKVLPSAPCVETMAAAGPRRRPKRAGATSRM